MVSVCMEFPHSKVWVIIFKYSFSPVVFPYLVGIKFPLTLELSAPSSVLSLSVRLSDWDKMNGSNNRVSLFVTLQQFEQKFDIIIHIQYKSIHFIRNRQCLQ